MDAQQDLTYVTSGQSLVDSGADVNTGTINGLAHASEPEHLRGETLEALNRAAKRMLWPLFCIACSLLTSILTLLYSEHRAAARFVSKTTAELSSPAAEFKAKRQGGQSVEQRPRDSSGGVLGDRFGRATLADIAGLGTPLGRVDNFLTLAASSFDLAKSGKMHPPDWKIPMTDAATMLPHWVIEADDGDGVEIDEIAVEVVGLIAQIQGLAYVEDQLIRGKDDFGASKLRYWREEAEITYRKRISAIKSEWTIRRKAALRGEFSDY